MFESEREIDGAEKRVMRFYVFSPSPNSLALAFS